MVNLEKPLSFGFNINSGLELFGFNLNVGIEDSLLLNNTVGSFSVWMSFVEEM